MNSLIKQTRKLLDICGKMNAIWRTVVVSNLEEEKKEIEAFKKQLEDSDNKSTLTIIELYD